MRLLLDTNIFLRMMTDESLLSPAAKAAIGDRNNEVWVSAVCAWEIAIKIAIGKLRLSDPVELFMTEGMRAAKARE
jgi:PIN domain nuclease of toxin-antitoxin system